jgi:hypothetical protein
MARLAQEGNRPPRLFQSLLRGLGSVSRARCSVLHAASQNRDRTEHRAWYGPGLAAHHAAKCGALRSIRGTLANQLFSSGLISLSKSSKVAAPLTISPLMKKVGVEFTLSTSLAYF